MIIQYYIGGECIPTGRLWFHIPRGRVFVCSSSSGHASSSFTGYTVTNSRGRVKTMGQVSDQSKYTVHIITRLLPCIIYNMYVYVPTYLYPMWNFQLNYCGRKIVIGTHRAEAVDDIILYINGPDVAFCWDAFEWDPRRILLFVCCAFSSLLNHYNL